MDEYDEALCRITCGDTIKQACRAAGANMGEFLLKLGLDKAFAKAYRAAKENGEVIRELRAQEREAAADRARKLAILEARRKERQCA